MDTKSLDRLLTKMERTRSRNKIRQMLEACSVEDGQDAARDAVAVFVRNIARPYAAGRAPRYASEFPLQWLRFKHLWDLATD